MRLDDMRQTTTITGNPLACAKGLRRTSRSSRCATLRRFARHLPIAALLLSAVACNTGADAGDDIRGGGAPSAKLNAAQKAGAYDAALREAFNVDSELVLLIDRSILPRTGGWESRDTLDAAVVRELRSAGTIRGECVPVRKDTKHGPTCVSNAPGYVVRVTDLFQVRGDTVRMFLAADRFQTASGIGPAQKFSFESGYELLRKNGKWTVVREGRRIQK
jgi:predicted small secreted protein